MDVHSLNEARERLGRVRRATHVSAAASGCAVLANGALGLLAHEFSLPLAVIGLLVSSATVWMVLERRDQLERLAMEPSAYLIPDVRSYGSKVVEPRRRAALAEWILEILAEAGMPDSIYLTDRVASNEQLLRRLADDLASPAVQIAPPSVVACRRLLTRAAESPLYNPYLPADALRSALRKIRLGIHLSS